MSALLRLFIDNRPTNLLKAQTGKGGNAYQGTTKAGKFGVGSVLVDNAVIPQGHEHVFSIGTEADSAVVIPLSKYDDAKVAKFGGSVNVNVLGEPKVLTVVVSELADGSRRIKASVTRPGGNGAATPKAASDVFSA